MRTPMPGILPPMGVVRISLDPPIRADEKAVVLSPARRNRPEGVPLPVTVEPDGDSVILTNLKDGFTAYLLLIVKRQSHDTASQMYHAIRSHLDNTRKKY